MSVPRARMGSRNKITTGGTKFGNSRIADLPGAGGEGSSIGVSYMPPVQKPINSNSAMGGKDRLRIAMGSI